MPENTCDLPSFAEKIHCYYTNYKSCPMTLLKYFWSPPRSRISCNSGLRTWAVLYHRSRNWRNYYLSTQRSSTYSRSWVWSIVCKCTWSNYIFWTSFNNCKKGRYFRCIFKVQFSWETRRKSDSALHDVWSA